MKILKIAVIGSGGREAAVIKKILESGRRANIYAIPGNGGIASYAECIDIAATDISGITDFCKKNSIDYVVVTPDDPLALGLVDMLTSKNILCFGPTQAAARIESSKVFSKNLMKKYNIPTAAYETFNDSTSANAYLKDYFANGHNSVVIKADGLALGKGVIICTSLEQAQSAVHQIMIEKKFASSGNQIVIEEFLEGPEVSVLSFCDGKTVVPMVSSMDHKRALDGDKGLNTGGMGAIAPNPFYTHDIACVCYNKIFLPTIAAMQQEGFPFKGCLYFGLMLTEDGPKVIEYNCRFGDPETQVVLPLLQSDLYEIMLACTNGTLNDTLVKFSAGAAACVVLASEGYPESYEKDFEISGIDKVEKDVEVFFAGVRSDNNKLYTNGGRVLGVTVAAANLNSAVAAAYKAAQSIEFKNKFCRSDIGKTALERLSAN
ncbi:MAG: phosphoribosylamine--glycine ligase [Termitinemataceae bacterium]|nr:MAG: phosphoribosylamine--glycine ligase [Termitinemataceae bacterium]